MASLVFSSTDLRLINAYWTASTWYAHLVTAVPVLANTTVANLTLATGGNYAPQVLTGLTTAADGTGAKVTFSNPTWVGLTTDNSATIKGMVICKRAGGSPATSDLVESYLELSSAYTTGGPVDFTVQIPTTGVLKIS